jgi:hypothetical protein
MPHKLKMFKIIFLWTTMFYLLLFSNCSTEPQYIFFKTRVRDQLQERAIKHCFGDFKVLQEEEFGPYTRASLECKE